MWHDFISIDYTRVGTIPIPSQRLGIKPNGEMYFSTMSINKKRGVWVAALLLYLTLSGLKMFFAF
jgi:hypothetical protein